MSDNDINIRRDHEEPAKDDVAEDTGGHGYKIPAEPAKDDDTDTEGHGFRGGVSPEGEPADPKTGVRPAPAAEEDTEGNTLKIHP